MNRAQRREEARTAKRVGVTVARMNRRHGSAEGAAAYLMKPMNLLNNCRPYDEAEIMADLIRIREAYNRLCDGTAEEEDFNRVAVAINLAKIRALDIDAVLADGIERAQDAMTACKARYDKHGRFGFDGQGLQDTEYAMEAHEEILRNSSPKQMENAMLVLRDVLTKQMGKSKVAELML